MTCFICPVAETSFRMLVFFGKRSLITWKDLPQARRGTSTLHTEKLLDLNPGPCSSRITILPPWAHLISDTEQGSGPVSTRMHRLGIPGAVSLEWLWFRRPSRTSTNWKVGGSTPSCSRSACQDDDPDAFIGVWMLDRKDLDVLKNACVVKTAFSAQVEKCYLRTSPQCKR